MNCPNCGKSIDLHQAGPETDACVAVVVMGSNKPVYAHSPHIESVYTDDGYWHCSPDYYEGDRCEWKAIPFSSSISDAWKVVEKVCEKADDFTLGFAWVCSFLMDDWISGLGPTVELAICRAALKCHLSNS